MRTLSPQELGQFLDDWRKDLRVELRNNISGQLSTRHASLASNVPDNFPSLNVVDLYLNPTVHDGEFDPNHSIAFSSGEPGAVDLAKFSASHFRWGRTAQAIIKRYGNAFFPAMAIRQLIQAAVDIDHGRALPDSGCPMIGKIIRRREAPDTCFLQEVQVLLVISLKLIRQICASLPGPTVTDANVLAIRHVATKFRAWLPIDMVRVVLPARLAAFELQSPATKRVKTSGTWQFFEFVHADMQSVSEASENVTCGSVAATSGPASTLSCARGQ